MQQINTAVVVYCIANGTRHYLVGHSVRTYDGLYLPNYDTSIALAKPFENDKIASQYLAKIANINNRKFLCETIKIKQHENIG